MAADGPLGATHLDTGEFLLGTVAVTPVFIESNGELDTESQHWSESEIDEVLTKIVEGVHWWSRALDALDTVHELEFVFDESFARQPFESIYEPIDRPSDDFGFYVGEFLTAQGIADPPTLEEGIFEFNVGQRESLQADWSFTIFVVDSSDDADGLFNGGGSFGGAFAYPGGLFFISPSTRPASTFAHEMGHIFWGRDEYPGGGSYTDRRGYYDAQNLNAFDNPDPNFVQDISIMRGGIPLSDAYRDLYSPQSTLALVGWRDSDGDGIFDVSDVPLSLDAFGVRQDDGSIELEFRGAAVPLLNRNSSGPQSDITLNRIDRLEYRIGDGLWQTVAEYGEQQVEDRVVIEGIPVDAEVEFRVIDASVGVTSDPVRFFDSRFLQTDADPIGLTMWDPSGQGDASQFVPLAGVAIELIDASGSPLPTATTVATELPFGDVDNDSLDGIALSVVGTLHDEAASVFLQEGQKVFASFDQQRARPDTRFDDDVALRVEMDVPVSRFSADVRAADAFAYARLEAFDAGGQLIARSTSPAFDQGSAQTIEVHDTFGRIASVKIFGHATTGIHIDAVDAGAARAAVSDAQGLWRLDDVAPGEYQVRLVAENMIHDFGDPITIVISPETGPQLQSATAVRVDSLRHRPALPFDVDGDQDVQPVDALLVINDIRRDGTRTLAASAEGFAIDVNNDGRVTSLDALMVINELRRRRGDGEGEANLVQAAGLADARAVDSVWTDFTDWPADAPSSDFAGVDITASTRIGAWLGWSQPTASLSRSAVLRTEVPESDGGVSRGELESVGSRPNADSFPGVRLVFES